MLVQYDPVLPDDGRLVLSHHYEVRLHAVLYLTTDRLTMLTGSRRASDRYCAVPAGIDVSSARGGHGLVPHARRHVRDVRCAL